MKKLLFFLLVVSFFSCQEETPKTNFEHLIEDELIEVDDNPKVTLPSYEFPKVRNVDSVNNTVFQATLESDLSKNKNNVYAASLLMAWDEIENQLKGELTDFESKELEKMYRSTSHQNVLLRNEYKTSVEWIGGIIKAKAEFKKTLPFSSPFTKHREKLKFGKDKVSSFGFKGERYNAEIMYYKNDNDFCLAITPREKIHQIYLMKSPQYKITFKENFDEILKKRKKQFANQKNTWKQHLQHDDIAKIPMIEFNLENNYEKMVNSYFFNTKRDTFQVLKAWQRTAFILNEKGAIIESEAEMVVDAVTEAAETKETPPTPKKLIFDKKFMIFLKRRDAKNPYFALQITDAELLIK